MADDQQVGWAEGEADREEDQEQIDAAIAKLPTPVVSVNNLPSGSVLPAVLPYGLKSPWTRTVIVDAGGKGDFTSIGSACVYVAAQTPTATGQWRIKVNPGVYTEDAFTIPIFTLLEGCFPQGVSPDGLIPIVKILPSAGFWAGGGGYFITMSNDSALYGVYCKAAQNVTKDSGVVLSGNNCRIVGCYLYFGLFTSTGAYNVSAVKHAGTSLATEIMFSTLATFDPSGLNPKTNARTVWDSSGHGISMGYCQIVAALHGCGFWEDAGNSNLYFVRMGIGSGGSAAYDIYIAGGTVIVSNTPYQTAFGTPIHFDRWFPTIAAIRQAPTATDTPTISKGAVAQSADIQQVQGSDAAVLHAIGPTGQIKTNQSASAAVSVGTLANKMPIYDAAGTLLGYIPIYATIT